jgi:hypothetical protein
VGRESHRLPTVEFDLGVQWTPTALVTQQGQPKIKQYHFVGGFADPDVREFQVLVGQSFGMHNFQGDQEFVYDRQSFGLL